MINMLDEVQGHFSALVASLFEGIKAKLETWKLTEKDWEQWTVAPGEEKPSDDYLKGYNAGVESVAGLLDLLLDEQV